MLATFDAQRICREGFQWLDKKASDRHRDGFLHLPEEDQLAVVRQMSDDAITPELSDPGHELFQLLKGEIIRAFYTSPAGLAELDFKGNGYYNQSPG
jgi:16S rRNA C1402 (ribose-2'-O) methylase RsmI